MRASRCLVLFIRRAPEQDLPFSMEAEIERTMRPLHRIDSSHLLHAGPAARVAIAVVLVWMVTMIAPLQGRAQASDAEEGAPIFMKWSAGIDFSQGQYGLDKKSTLYYIPLGLTLDYRRFRTKLTIPFLVSSGPTQANGDIGLDSTERRGLGQIQLGASYLFEPIVSAMPWVELAGSVIAPSESRRELGTGLWAFGLEVSLFKSFGGITPFVSGGRRFYERCDCARSLDDRFFASAGVSLNMSERVSLGIAYDWLESARGDVPDAHEIVPFASFRVTRNWSVGPYGVFGASDGSPDIGAGLTVSFRP